MEGEIIEPWYVYFFPERDKENPAIKIGFSRDPIGRLKTLQTGHPNKIGCEGWYLLPTQRMAREYEKELHKHFKKYRIRGEWFKYNDEIKNFIQTLLFKKNFTRYFH